MVVTRLQKWGNSLAVRIPRNLVNALSLESNAELEIREEDGKIILTPVSSRKFDLQELLAGITPQNLHGEIDMGTETGNEVW